MQQIKLFIGREDHLTELENEVNTWIAESGVNVLSISGNIAPQSILPTREAATPSGLGAKGGTPGRRFASSDIMVFVTYEKG